MSRAALIAATLGVAACVSSRQLIGDARPPLPPERVQLYLEAPARPYERIAVLTASSKWSFSFSSQGKGDAVIRRLKQEAAKLGANGVLLQGISDEPGASVGTALGTGYEGPRGTVDLAFGASTLMLQRYGRGIAVWIPPAP